MNEYEYSFLSTSQERKRLAKGARARKNGSRSKKCSLPSDRLTKKQKEELNGKVITYNPNKPMTWIEFMELPPDLQHDYLTRLVNDYKGHRKDICKMFDISSSTLYRFVKERMSDKVIFPMDGPKGTAPEWLNFIGADEPKAEDVILPSENVIVAPAASDEVKQPIPADASDELATVDLEILSGTLRYIGDPRAVFEKALLALDPSKVYRISVMFDTDFVKEE